MKVYTQEKQKDGKTAKLRISDCDVADFLSYFIFQMENYLT